MQPLLKRILTLQVRLEAKAKGVKVRDVVDQLLMLRRSLPRRTHGNVLVPSLASLRPGKRKTLKSVISILRQARATLVRSVDLSMRHHQLNMRNPNAKVAARIRHSPRRLRIPQKGRSTYAQAAEDDWSEDE